jgi:ubiquinone/menaquinone biosynthesis C-methylase UbiE
MQEKNAELNSWVIAKAKCEKEYDAYSKESYSLVIKRINELLNKGKILDIGCGTGAFSFRFEKAGFEVVGLDLSYELIKIAKSIARKKKSNAKFIVGDAEKLPFDNDCFDICFCGAMLHHFTDFQNVIKEAKRVTKPKGFVIVLEPNADNWHIRLAMDTKSPVRFSSITANERAVSKSELNKVFSKVDLKKMTHEYLFMTSRKHKIQEKKSWFSAFFYSIIGFIPNSIQGFWKRLLAFILFNLVHILAFFQGPSRKNNYILFYGKKEGNR